MDTAAERHFLQAAQNEVIEAVGDMILARAIKVLRRVGEEYGKATAHESHRSVSLERKAYYYYRCLSYDELVSHAEDLIVFYQQRNVHLVTPS